MRYTFGAALAALTLGAAALSHGGPQEFQVVAHPSVHGTWISKTNLSALFTGRADRWGDKVVAKPVDQSAKSAVRHAFTTAVLGLSMGEIQRYWQDRVAAAHVLPPPIKSSDEEVLRYVAATPGGVGYVAPDAVIPASVKVISVTD